MSDSEAAPAAAAQNQLDKKSVAKKPRAKAAPKEPKEPKVPLISAHKQMKIYCHRVCVCCFTTRAQCILELIQSC
jgi:hypothetical protein